jgi:hypothetical protein
VFWVHGMRPIAQQDRFAADMLGVSRGWQRSKGRSTRVRLMSTVMWCNVMRDALGRMSCYTSMSNTIQKTNARPGVLDQVVFLPGSWMPAKQAVSGFIKMRHQDFTKTANSPGQKDQKTKTQGPGGNRTLLFRTCFGHASYRNWASESDVLPIYYRTDEFPDFCKYINHQIRGLFLFPVQMRHEPQSRAR